jgi:hypothetical protein
LALSLFSTNAVELSKFWKVSPSTTKIDMVVGGAGAREAGDRGEEKEKAT